MTEKQWDGSSTLFLVGKQSDRRTVPVSAGFHISTLKAGTLVQALPNEFQQTGLAIQATETGDAVVMCCLRDSKVCLFEFSKNTFFNRYALTQTKTYSVEEGSIHTVISSPWYYYAYTVIPQSGEIQIATGTPSGNIGYSACLILIGILFFLVSRKRERTT